VVLYGRETRSLALREQHTVRGFDNRVLRWISGPKRDEMTAVWSKVHDDELRKLYFSPIIIITIKSSRLREVRHEERIRIR
jgi:hypothetical protein